MSPNNVPGSPTTPDSPEELENHQGRKVPVRRSNSSPEMSSNWKPSLINLHKDIEEQEEDELTVINHQVSENEGTNDQRSEVPEFQSLQLSQNQSQNAGFVEAKENRDCGTLAVAANNTMTVNTNNVAKGSTSPFRRSYEAIPEENTQRTGSLSGSPEQQLEALNPVKRDRVSTISVCIIFAFFVGVNWV